jgi:hypothetical protein
MTVPVHPEQLREVSPSNAAHLVLLRIHRTQLEVESPLTFPAHGTIQQERSEAKMEPKMRHMR